MRKKVGFTPQEEPAPVVAPDACLVSRESSVPGQFEYCTLREYHDGDHVFGASHMPALWEPGSELADRIDAIATAGAAPDPSSVTLRSGGIEVVLTDPANVPADGVYRDFVPDPVGSAVVTPGQPNAPSTAAMMESVGLATPADPALALDDVPAGELPTIQFPAGRFYSLARRALKHEETALLKLSKANDDAGYPIEARAVRHDALAIGAEMLPLFDAQTELPLATDEEVASGIINALRQLIHRHVKEPSETIDHEAVFMKALGERLAEFAIAIAESAYTAGKIARENEPEVLVIRSIKTLWGQRDGIR